MQYGISVQVAAAPRWQGVSASVNVDDGATSSQISVPAISLKLRPVVQLGVNRSIAFCPNLCGATFRI